MNRWRALLLTSLLLLCGCPRPDPDSGGGSGAQPPAPKPTPGPSFDFHVLARLSQGQIAKIHADLLGEYQGSGLMPDDWTEVVGWRLSRELTDLGIADSGVEGARGEALFFRLYQLLHAADGGVLASIDAAFVQAQMQITDLNFRGK